MEIPEYYRCPNGHLMYEDERYCSVCGSARGAMAGSETRKCPECYTKYWNGERFCPEDGEELR